jgi:glycosyltransferase involved in cell wall biosynthesis
LNALHFIDHIFFAVVPLFLWSSIHQVLLYQSFVPTNPSRQAQAQALPPPAPTTERLPGTQQKTNTNSAATTFEPFTCSSGGNVTKKQKIGRATISVLVPVYNGSAFMEELMKNILNQTYPITHLEILVSLDLSEDAALSEAIVRRVQVENPRANIQVFRAETERLHWGGNMNFLFHKATYQYLSVVAHDDLLPPNFLEELARCLDEDADTVYCFPYVKVIRMGDDTRPLPHTFDGKSVNGSQHKRVEKALDNLGIHLRGLMRNTNNRRLSDGTLFFPYSIPRLHRNHHSGGSMMRIFHAIDGNLKRVDVPYYKRFHADSTHAHQDKDLQKLGTLDWAVRAHNYAYSYSSSIHRQN